jgi:hypothetical protein
MAFSFVPETSQAAKACDKTSKAARSACKSAAKEDYFLAVGNCNNLSSDAARKACISAAKATAKEGGEECKDQLEARKALCEQLGQTAYDPVIDPNNFLTPAQTAANPNPYLPLVPGTVRTYEGPDETITVTVTNETKVILGVTTIVVRDVVVDDMDVPVEDTDDWFAQDVAGNVWYFGELSKSFENGELESLGGSWTAGVDGAKPGIVMKANPMVGDVYRQEFALGNAEDAGEVISTTGTESTPGASCTNECLVTRDFTPLEPGAEENKYYKAGVGLILEIDLETGERVELQP